MYKNIGMLHDVLLDTAH